MLTETTTDNQRYKWIALAIASLGSLLGVLNSTTLIIALPTLMLDLNTTLVGVMWTLIAYMLVLTILAPASGRLADIYGRKKLYVFGIIAFTIASLLCGVAADITQLIIFRIIQAIGGAILVANSTLLVVDAFPHYELGRAMGILSVIMAAAFVVGPILGGVLTLIDWRLNFFINLPIGIAVAYIAHTRLREVKEFSVEPFDLVGMLLFAVAFVALTVYLGVAVLVGPLSVLMLAVLAVGIISLVAFIRWELTSSHPLIDLSLFKIRIFAFGQASVFLNAIARGAVMILLILFFQGLRGYDPLMASILIAPMAIGLIVGGPIGGSLSDKYGSRLISTIGLIISLVGLAGLALMQYDTPYWVLAAWMVVNGIGSGLFQPPNTSAIMASVPFERRGVASSMRAFLGNTGMVISMTIAMPLLITTVPLDTMMNMFVVGGMNMPMDTQILFTDGIAFVFIISAILTIPAVIVSAMRGKDDVRVNIEMAGTSPEAP
ncbi:DHA2 family efflux MFS transporter permease subunit [Methanogenium organophilum]|uniref:DHA2 family efflux MFS transporter permease subunit n=1 Tax=Methanogenium organophilum TaxID=2199 RepID=A0A9X9S4Z5_METOG|nr:DHA2 family efflux MFS transporter permease subunit [Methanogenium organophilum]WAI01558.1 DHA2 family efflux MFS transporter permease subunit [Methanogenium organophilum]